MKSTILLTTAIFLASAPAPDSKTISEISAGFLSPAGEYGLMAAEHEPKLKVEPTVEPDLDNERFTQSNIED